MLIPLNSQASQAIGEYQSSNRKNCEELLHDLENNGALLHQLLNPIITSKGQLEETISRAVDFQNCLNQVSPTDKSERQKLAEVYNLIFLIFTKGTDTPPGETQLEIVQLDSVDDPAVRILREKIGIHPPPGYIFLRSYTSRQVMHPIVRATFSDPTVAGVTILNRYIAILTENPESWIQQALQNQSLPSVRSHELVHAYIGSAMASGENAAGESLPKWFEEGLATYLTKGSKSHTVMTPNLSITTTASTEYQQYEQVFKYMQHRLGKEALYRSIGKVVRAGDIDTLLSDLSLPSEDWLFASTREWQEQRAIRSTSISLAGILLLSGVLYLSLPEYQCSCGFSGRKKDFAGGICAQCGRPVNHALVIRGSNKITFIPSCEVCGRRFWPWQRDQLQLHRYPMRAWLPAPTPGQQPHARSVRRICIHCHASSQQSYTDYLQYTQDQIEQSREATRSIIEQWLVNAPNLPFLASESYIPNSVLDVDDLVDAALAQRFGEWSQIESEFEFNPPLSMLPSSFEPPNGYTSVFRRIADGMSGSIFSAENNQYWIIWHDNPFINFPE